ncbi:hypothetical protein [Streptomyces sp. NBC_01198]|uniref:hypothetical protein n=1 Tax=Streptomyces sp. NBC_01198 TaxID=2903769 RepID=UPI002E0F9566|nr:hypothetical protein OG702_04900 [Streptomyces sp. NBC_01198]
MRTRSSRIAAHIELISLVVLLANLATAHVRSVSSLMGPTHLARPVGQHGDVRVDFIAATKE